MRFWSLGHRDVPSTTGPCHFTLVSYRVYLIGEEQGKHISYSPRARCLERAVLQRTPRLLSRYPIRSLQSLFFPLCWTLDNLTHWSIYITALYVIERINSRVLPVYRLQWVDESMVRCEFSCILGLTAILYVWVKDCTMGCFGFFLSTGCSEVAGVLSDTMFCTFSFARWRLSPICELSIVLLWSCLIVIWLNLKTDRFLVFYIYSGRWLVSSCQIFSCDTACMFVTPFPGGEYKDISLTIFSLLSKSKRESGV